MAGGARRRIAPVDAVLTEMGQGLGMTRRADCSDDGGGGGGSAAADATGEDGERGSLVSSSAATTASGDDDEGGGGGSAGGLFDSWPVCVALCRMLSHVVACYFCVLFSPPAGG